MNMRLRIRTLVWIFHSKMGVLQNKDSNLDVAHASFDIVAIELNKISNVIIQRSFFGIMRLLVLINPFIY